MPRRHHDPVYRPEDDLLNRATFVEHLERALMSDCTDCSDVRATGSIVSLVGDWGSGKSSILHLVESRLHNRNDCIVIRFVPWFVNSGDHLIRYFFELLARSLKPDYVSRDDLYEDLIAYGRVATYGADIHTPGSGAAARGLLDFIGRRIKRDPDIFSIKKRIEKELDSKCLNIVCLIDEVDRLSEFEIREVARLMRAIGDFQRISYLVSFDEDRVSRALGGQGDAGLVTGREYLQKIVNLRIEMPRPIPDEGLIILRSQMDRLCGEGLLPRKFSDNETYDWLAEQIAGTGASPRTIVRAAEKFSIIRRMIGDDLDWCDALAFAFLEEQAFEVSKFIREEPEKFVRNPASLSEYAFLIKNERDRQQELRDAVKYDQQDEAVREILLFLFPVLGQVSDERAKITDPSFNRIQFRSPLHALLRFGLLPGRISIDEIRAALTSQASLKSLLIDVLRSSDGEKLDQVFDYLGRNGSADLIRQTTIDALAEYESGGDEIAEMRAGGGKVADTFVEDKRLSEDAAVEILKASLSDKWSQVARILRRYIFMHGMYKWSKRNYGNPNIKDHQKVGELVSDYVAQINRSGGIEQIIRNSKTSHSIWIMMDYYQDTGEAIAGGFESVKCDPDLFAKFLKLCIGQGYSTDYSSVSGLFSREEVRDIIDKHGFVDSTDAHLRISASEALGRWGPEGEVG